MRYSRLFLPTLKEVPSEAEIVSHKLMLRAGMIRRLASGLYSYLPLGLRALRRVEAIIREEMTRAGAQEVLLPMVQPRELWDESGRWKRYGKELLRLKDRHGRDFCLGPTHEEVITDLVRREVRSYRDLPLNLYQIQTKFRDEIRPRFGLMRSREFIMKDAYSFDADEEGLDRQYRNMFDAYCRIFERCGLEFKAVQADTGTIGGSASHEFMVIAQTGEDEVASCTVCKWASNIELAEVLERPSRQREEPLKELKRVHTPGVKRVEDVARFLNIDITGLVKSLIFEADTGQIAIAMVRGDHELNEVKLRNALGCEEVRLADQEIVRRVTGAPVGFAGPLGLKEKVILVADNSIRDVKNFVVGANEGDTHFVNVNWNRDIGDVIFSDIRNITVHDPCPRCGSAIEIRRGIEVGHVFRLGTKYSEALGATFLDSHGRQRPIVMGCYGIGVGRTVQAAIEQNNDKYGIVFPPAIAPFDCIISVVNIKDDEQRNAGEGLYEAISSKGFECLLDDRNERPGVKFKDSELIGIPVRVTVGRRLKLDGSIEVFYRRSRITRSVPIKEILRDPREIFYSKAWEKDLAYHEIKHDSHSGHLGPDSLLPS